MSKPQSIIRAKHDSKYFSMARSTAQDERLSMEALGIVTYLLSKPTDWEIMVPDLMRRAGCGKTKMYRILDELKKYGYLTGRERIRGEDGTFTWTPYILHERPVIVEFPTQDEPLPQKPDMDEPDTENPHSLNSTEKENTEVQKTLGDKSQEQPEEKPQEVLGRVIGKPPVTGQDFGLYGKICKQLKQGGILPDEYPDYVKWVKQQSQAQGNWKVTVASLTSKGRVSDYVAWKNKPVEKTVSDSQYEAQRQAELEMYNLLFKRGESA